MVAAYFCAFHISYDAGVGRCLTGAGFLALNELCEIPFVHGVHN